MSKFIVIATLVASVIGVPLTARSHHVVSEYGITAAEPRTLTEVSLELRHFDFGDDTVSGTAAVLGAFVEYAPVQWLSGAAHLPIGTIRYDDGRTETGLGDVTLSLRGRLYADHHGLLLISAGLGTEIPTGDESAGLGSGHFEVAPFVTVSSAPTQDIVLFTTIVEQYSIEGEDDDHGDHDHDHDHAQDEAATAEVHGAIIAPHENHESSVRVGAAYILGPVYVSAQTEVIFAWSRQDGDLFGPVTATGEVGWRPVDQLRIALAADAPLVTPDRFDWKTRLAAAWMF